MRQVSNPNFAILRRYESFWALLLFVLLTTFAAWNILTNMNGVLIGRDNDVYINPWADWWTYKALTEPEISLWQTDMMFYPTGADLTYHSFSHLNTLVSLGLRPLFGQRPAYNIAILLNFVLAGLSMFHLGRYMTNSSLAGIIAGIVFAFNSHNVYQSAHPVLISVWCFPWMTLFFIRAVRENKPTLALVAAIFVFLGAATSTLLVILSVFWMGLLVVFMFLSPQFPRPNLKILLVFGLASAMLIFPTVYWLIRNALFNNNNNFVIEASISIPTDLLSPFLPHWLAAYIKRGLYIGIMPALLIFFAIGRQSKPATLWLILTALTYLFAIGPEPRFLGVSLDITLPWSLLVIPILRHTHRLMILFSLGLALLAAYGWLGIEKSLSAQSFRLKILVAVIVGAAIYGEYTAPPFPNTPIQISTFYTDYLDDVPQDVALATVPIGRQEDKRYMYYQTIHEHPMVGGVISRAGNGIFAFINGNPLLSAGIRQDPMALPENPEAALQQLAGANVGYLIIDKTLTDNEEIWRSRLPMQPIFEDELLLVYSTGLINENIQSQ